jgi:hypothetical protein
MSEQVESFIMYESFYEAMESLHGEQFEKVMRTINDYAFYGTIPVSMDITTKMIFTLVKPQIDANSKRRNNGSKGGAPAGNNNAGRKQPELGLPDEQEQPQAEPETTDGCTENNQRLNEKQPNVNVNVNGNVNANDNANTESAQARTDAEHPSLPGPDDSPPSRKKFVKPTIRQVKDYCFSRNNAVDPQAWYDHYESNGWKIGAHSPMKDWQAAVRTWEHNNYSLPKNVPKFQGMDGDRQQHDKAGQIMQQIIARSTGGLQQ